MSGQKPTPKAPVAGDCRVAMRGFDARRIEVWTGGCWLELRGIEVESVCGVCMSRDGTTSASVINTAHCSLVHDPEGS